ncbi:WAT1-related protein At2g39510-like [Punica granatum]|uniref:WAT1-related protein At2g39510-like n=1 Tax=Punica granatum TaxID=22663 RepID=A0A6P8DVE3_PUNGR|nr:WAT1-related protein At2g39510-like [Punica granatum]
MGAAYPYVAMVLVQLCYSSSNMLLKVALERGLNQFVFVAYRHISASLLLCPFAYVLERRSVKCSIQLSSSLLSLIVSQEAKRDVRKESFLKFSFSRKRRHRLFIALPSAVTESCLNESERALSLKLVAKIFALSLVGTTIHLNVFYAGLEYISPTVATTLSNLIPGVTFLITVLLRRETVTLKTPKGRAKVIGTLISIGGSFIFTLWKGKCLINGHVQRPLIDIYGSNGNERKLSHVKESWLKGSALILLSNFTWSLWLIFQGVVYKDYPAQLSLNALICLFAAFHSSILALFATWDLNLWRLEWNVQLWTIIYSGVVVSALVNNLLIWGIGRKGPVFAAMFHPLQVVIVGIFWCIAFAERFHLGSLIGTFLIILGLYCVLWGKTKENETADEPGNKKGSSDTKNIEVSIVGNYQVDSEKCTSAGSRDQNGVLGTELAVRS